MARMEKVTYTPTEFAAVFGKERTWAYRQLYAGKVQAVTDLGRTLIPKSEVDRLLKEAGRYVGAGAKVRKSKAGAEGSNGKKPSSGAKSWAEAVKKRKTPSSQQQASARSVDGRKPSSPALPRPCDQATSRQSVYQRLTRCKPSRKDAASRGE